MCFFLLIFVTFFFLAFRFVFEQKSVESCGHRGFAVRRCLRFLCLMFVSVCLYLNCFELRISSGIVTGLAGEKWKTGF